MPYANMPDDPELTAKMDRCVSAVMKQGKPKGAAVAICYTSLMGKKAVVENDNPYLVLGELVTLDQFEIGDVVEVKQGRGWTCPSCGHHQAKKPEEAICPGCGAQMGRALVAATSTALSSQVKCLALGCGNDASWQLVVAGRELHYCDEHQEGAVKMLERHELTLEGKKQGKFVTIEGKPVFVGGPGAGGGGGGDSGGVVKFESRPGGYAPADVAVQTGLYEPSSGIRTEGKRVKIELNGQPGNVWLTGGKGKQKGQVFVHAALQVPMIVDGQESGLTRIHLRGMLGGEWREV